MNREAVAELLRLTRPALDAMAQPWCVIGSAALMIARAAVDDCPDLDILTTAAGAAFLENAWVEQREGGYVLDAASPFLSQFSRYAWPLLGGDGAVEVMGDLTLNGVPVTVQEIAAAPFDGMKVPIPTLAEQARLLRLFGRPKDVARLSLLARLK